MDWPRLPLPSRSRGPEFAILIPVILLLVSGISLPLRSQSAPPISSPMPSWAPELVEELERSGRVKAFLRFETGPLEGRSLAERLVAFREATAVPREILEDAGVRVLYAYRYSPVLFVELVGSSALDLLVDLPGWLDARPDARGQGALDLARPLTRIDRVQRGWDLRGEGRTLAVLDSGIDVDHPDFTDRILPGGAHYLDGGFDVGREIDDGHGHGTNVSGIIGASGEISEPGCAPGASLLVVRVLDSQNRGFVSDWAAGLEHVIDLHRESPVHHVDAINLSLGTDSLFPGICDGNFSALSGACETATELGIAVVAASHNQGSLALLAAPACYSSVISVGSTGVTVPLTVSTFTNRNAHLEVLAPGQSIRSSGRGGVTSSFSGTSQATPQVVALFALARQVFPGLGPAEFRAFLADLPETIFDASTGLEFPFLDFSAFLRDLARRDCDDSGVLESRELAPDRPICGPRLLRGDANGDAILDITDPIEILQHLFRAAPVRTDCPRALDWNRDEAIDLSDAVSGLRFLFLGQLPFEEYDDTCRREDDDGLDCALDRSCRPG